MANVIMIVWLPKLHVKACPSSGQAFALIGYLQLLIDLCGDRHLAFAIATCERGVGYELYIDSFY